MYRSKGPSFVTTSAATDETGIATFAKKAGQDESLFTLNGSTGELTFNTAPDFETKSSYTLTVQATDTLNNVSEKELTVNVTDTMI